MEHLPVRLQNKISPEPNSGCWLWEGFIRPDGYGAVWNNGRSTYAHIVVYELCKGVVPFGLQLDHLCRLRCCVNPDHLEAVTKIQNVLRGIGPTAKNARKTHCKRGHLFSETAVIRNGSRSCILCERIRRIAWGRKNKARRAKSRRRYYERSGR